MNSNNKKRDFNLNDYDMCYSYQLPNDQNKYGYFIDYDHLYQAMLEAVVEQSSNKQAIAMLEAIGITCR